MRFSEVLFESETGLKEHRQPIVSHSCIVSHKFRKQFSWVELAIGIRGGNKFCPAVIYSRNSLIMVLVLATCKNKDVLSYFILLGHLKTLPPS